MTHDQCEQVTIYALGALDAEEARDFERHLREGCAPCRAEVEAFRATAEQLALAAAARAPRPEVRARLLAATAAAQPSSPFSFALGADRPWAQVGPGVFTQEIADDARNGYRSYLIRLDPGGSVGRHDHGTTEHCHVLSGDLHVAGRHLHAGDYHRAAAGSTHDGIRSDGGCLLLIVETAA